MIWTTGELRLVTPRIAVFEEIVLLLANGILVRLNRLTRARAESCNMLVQVFVFRFEAPNF